jgi:hypothetical protein
MKAVPVLVAVPDPWAVTLDILHQREALDALPPHRTPDPASFVQITYAFEMEEFAAPSASSAMPVPV